MSNYSKNMSHLRCELNSVEKLNLKKKSISEMLNQHSKLIIPKRIQS